MRIVRGRNFESTDVADGAPVAILNQALAEHLFGADDPVGRRVTWTGEVLAAIGMRENRRTIVGVVSNSRDDGPALPPPHVLFEPLAQNSMGWFPGAFVIRGTEAAAHAGEVQQIIHRLAPDVPVLRMQTFEEIRRDAIGAERLNTALVGVLGALVLVISAVGLAGILGFFISERTGEIGIRMSLGAAPQRVLGMVLGDGARLLDLGIGLGLVGALAVSRFLDGLLFGLEAGDPRTLVTVVLVMSAVGLGAAAVPAIRAARIDPLVAIRRE